VRSSPGRSAPTRCRSSIPGPGGHAIPFNPVKHVAYTAGVAATRWATWCAASLALVAAVLTVAALGGRVRSTALDDVPAGEQDELSEPLPSTGLAWDGGRERRPGEPAPGH
jgi:hypothetical protein